MANLAEAYKDKLDFNKTVGAIDLGTYTLLIYPRKEGGYLFRAAKSDRHDFINAQTKDLSPDTTAYLTGLDPDLLEMVEVGGVLTPQVTWRSGSGVLEEPQIQFTTKDAFEFSSVNVTLFDQEVIDLFAKPKDSKEFKSASIVSFNTSVGDIMGIAVRRNTPVIILVAPALEASRMSSKEGLNSLLNGILTGLTSRLTTFEVEVLNAIAAAKAADYFQMPYDGATLGGQLQNNLLMQVYTARTFFLAREAEVTGEGLNYKPLIEYFPYLRTLGKKGGLSGLLAGAATSKGLKLTPDLWDELVEDASKSIALKNPNDKTPRPRTIRPLAQRGIKLNAPAQVMTPAEIAAMKQKDAAAATAPAVPPTVVRPAAPTVSPEVIARQETARLVKSSVDKLSASLGQLRTARPEKLTAADYDDSNARLKKVINELQGVIASKKRGRPLATPTQVNFQKNQDTLTVYGFANGERILNFVAPAAGEYFNAVDKSIQKWLTDSDYQNTALRTDPKARTSLSLQTSPRLAPLAEDLRVAFNFKDARMINGAIDLVYASYLILVEKVLYLLKEAGEQLCQNGQEVEIVNWAYYAQATLSKLIDIDKQMR